jgi:hypothetical protein
MFSPPAIPKGTAEFNTSLDEGLGEKVHKLLNSKK